MIGSTIGRYKIVERLGAGGMGEVFRAEDTTLGRPVALKFLAAHLLNDDEAKARFLREARAAAALHHPNICTVFEVAEETGKTFLAMAFLEGESLEDRIANGPLPLKDALDIGRQIAEGLEAAHEKGIVHRDIKPANVLVDSKGRATILDFGLARLNEASKLTRADQTVGTAAYMSPEQIQGGEVDHRTDVWALGCVLYEMVAGLRPFKGQYDQALAYEIVQEDPEPLTAVRAGVPMDLEFIVGKCLSKDRESRYGNADELRVDLKSLAARMESGKSAVLQSKPAEITPAAPADSASPRKFGVGALVVAGLAAAALGVALAWWLGWGGAPSDPIPRYRLRQMTFDTGLTTDPAISRDGSLLAYASDRAGERNLDIWVQHTGAGEPRRLTTNPADEDNPDISPDGSLVAFHSQREPAGVYVMPALGGEPRLFGPDGDFPRFSPDGRWIAYHAGNPPTIMRVSADGGQPEPIGGLSRRNFLPVWSPDATRLLIMSSSLGPADAEFGIVTLATGAAVKPPRLNQLLEDSAPLSYLQSQLPLYPVDWTHDDRLLLASRLSGVGGMLSVTLRDGDLTPGAEAVPLTLGPGRHANARADASGRVAFVVEQVSKDIWALPLDADAGRLEGDPVRITNDTVVQQRPSVSEDGTRLAYHAFRDERSDVFVMDLQSGVVKTLAASPVTESSAFVSADGEEVLYAAGASSRSIMIVPAAGGPPRTVLEDSGALTGWSRKLQKALARKGRALNLVDTSSGEVDEFLTAEQAPFGAIFTPDERWVLFYSQTGERSRQAFVAPLHGERPVGQDRWIALTEEDHQIHHPRFSPDGGVLYFLSDRDGFDCFWGAPGRSANKATAGRIVSLFPFARPPACRSATWRTPPNWARL